MQTLVVGGGGFVGRHIVQALCQRGHHVTVTARATPAAFDSPCPRRHIVADYAKNTTSEFWVEKLQDIDCVVNAAGILRETTDNRFKTVHHHGPCALFRACSIANIRRVIQVSALGVDATASSGYHTSKFSGDECLRMLELDWIILQPSVIYGLDSGSGRMFNNLARLPLAAVPGKGDQMLQPIHADDLAEVVANLIENNGVRRETIAAVGPQVLTYTNFLRTLRRSLGAKPAALIGIPMPLMRALAIVAAVNPKSPLTPDTLAMLEQGSIADGKTFAEILGHPPRSPEEFETRR